MSADLAGSITSAIIRPDRGTRWRFAAASRHSKGIANTSFHLTNDAAYALARASSEHTFGKEISLHDSLSCCGCIVHLNHPDMVPACVYWRVTHFFDRDGREANVFVWSEPEKTFFRRSLEWFQCRRIL